MTYSKYCYTYLLKIKDEVLSKFKVYKAKAENQQEKQINITRSDRGGKYTSNEFTLFCELYRIIYEVTALYSPQSNNVAKWKIQILLDMVNAMIISSDVP